MINWNRFDTLFSPLALASQALWQIRICHKHRFLSNFDRFLGNMKKEKSKNLILIPPFILQLWLFSLGMTPMKIKKLNKLSSTFIFMAATKRCHRFGYFFLKSG